MAFYEWTNRLSVGDDSIDKQHRVLIGYINELAEALGKPGEKKAILSALLTKLIAYTKMHFMYEEMLFDKNQYPDKDAHKQYHKKLLTQVDEFNTRFKSGDATLGEELLKFLMDWLNEHILKSDAAYVQFAHNKKASSR